MNFTAYYYTLSADEKKTLAKNASTSTAYLSQLARGHRNAGFVIIQKLIKAEPNISYAMFETLT